MVILHRHPTQRWGDGFYSSGEDTVFLFMWVLMFLYLFPGGRGREQTLPYRGRVHSIITGV